MIDSSPRPLPQKRLAQLVHGLQDRMDGNLQQIAVEVDKLAEEISECESEHRERAAQKRVEREQQRELTTTDWDEALQNCWDSAELKSYSAIFETAEHEGQLRQRAKARVAEINAEAQKRVVGIEKRFLQAKDTPLKRLKNFRGANQKSLEELQGVERAAETAIAQRSLSLPKFVLAPPQPRECKKSNDAYDAMQRTLEEARRHCRQITDNRLAAFFDSVWWWGACGLLFLGLTVLLTVTGVASFVSSILLAATTSVVVVLLGFLGVRPWLKRAAAKEFPKVKEFVTLGEHYHEQGEKLAVAENDAELKRLAKKRDDRFEQVQHWQQQELKEIVERLDADIAEIRSKAKEDKLSARDQLTSSLADTNQQFEFREQHEQQQCEQRAADLKQELDTTCGSLRDRIDELNRGGALRMRVATQKALKVIARSQRWAAEHFPDWSAFEQVPKVWPQPLSEPILPLGSMAIAPVLPEQAKLDLPSSSLRAPVLFAPIADQYLVVEGDASHPLIRDLVKNLIMRALTALPAGRTQVCVVDPPGMGSDFGWLMHLGDFDPQLVSHRVWTQPGHIAKQLSSLALAAEDFIQQSLRNQYRDITQYNRDAGALAEPYRILVWSSLPSGLDDQSWKSLKSLLESGARCGIVPLLIVDPQAGWPSQDQSEFLKRRGLHLRIADDQRSFVVARGTGRSLHTEPLAAADDRLAQEIIQEVGRRALASHRVEVPLAQMLPDASERWQADSSRSLEIPIGQSGVGRTHSLKLGVGTAQHAIIAGKTGSGKSSLLHALVTSAMLMYSPERLRLVLLDFKKGVEFQVYSDNQIPHADIIGIESHREFGLSALEFVDGCMQRRGEAFREAGVQDIASWNATRPDHPLPRMLVVVDEFQELFVEDDKLSGQASLILDRIVRQGRSFGVHAVLSSQTLAGAYSLPRTTLGQMAVRIALQCDPSDAQIIFADDNPAAARLKFPGQAVYNDAGGRIEGNQPMQIGWLAKNTQEEWLHAMRSGYSNHDPTTNRLGRTVVYDGNRAATWSDDNANLAVSQAQQQLNPDATWCVVGESVAINPAVVFPLTRQAGRNILLVGGDDSQAAAAMHVINASCCRAAQHGGNKLDLYLVQGAKPTDARSLALPTKLESLPCQTHSASARDASTCIADIHSQLQRRMEEEDSTDTNTILLTLIQIGRMRDLRREDDFASFGESELTVDKKLEEILRDGPSYGIHVLIWAESYSTVNRWLSRSALREMEIRLLMQMSANDSTNLVDSVAASRLGDHVMLLFDEATGQEQRFRPFAIESLEAISGWNASNSPN